MGRKWFKFLMIWVITSVAFVLIIGTTLKSFSVQGDAVFAITFLLCVLVTAAIFFNLFWSRLRVLNTPRRVAIFGFGFIGSFMLVISVIFSMAELESRGRLWNSGEENSIYPRVVFPSSQTIVQEGAGQDPSDIKKDEAEERKKEPGRTYPITDGKTYRIIPGRQYACEEKFWATSHHQEILEVKEKGHWKEVYRTEDLGDGLCFASIVIYEKSIQVSPLGDYVKFALVGWEWSWGEMIKVSSKKHIFAKDMHVQDDMWSKNGRNYAAVSVLEEFGGSGRDAVWVSRFNNPDILEPIFDLKSWANDESMYSLDYVISNLSFKNNQLIEFSVYRYDDHGETGDELSRYQYDLKTKALKTVFGRNM